MKLDVDTPAKRARLAPPKNPYWCSIAGGRGGVWVGYRRTARGPGVWIARTVITGQRAEERMGTADDLPAVADALDYKTTVAAALDWSNRQHAVFEAGSTGRGGKKPTVRYAVETYIEQRRKRSKTPQRQSIVGSCLPMSSRRFASVPRGLTPLTRRAVNC